MIHQGGDSTRDKQHIEHGTTTTRSTAAARTAQDGCNWSSHATQGTVSSKFTAIAHMDHAAHDHMYNRGKSGGKEADAQGERTSFMMQQWMKQSARMDRSMFLAAIESEFPSR